MTPHHLRPASEPDTLSAPGDPAPARITRIRFLDELSPDAQQAYHDEQERRKEEKKSRLEEVGESETRIERVSQVMMMKMMMMMMMMMMMVMMMVMVSQPPAAVLASQTAENTQYNRHQAGPDQEQEPEPESGPGPPQPPPPASQEPAPRYVDIQTRYREQVRTLVMCHVTYH